MLDSNFIREHLDQVRNAILHKKASVDLNAALAADDERRTVQREIEDLNRKRNEHANVVKNAGKPDAVMIAEGKKIKEKLSGLEDRLKSAEERSSELLSKIPNVFSEDTPVGSDESKNKVIRTIGKLPEFDFKPKEHWELGEQLDVIDTARGAKVSGARFAFLKGAVAMMEFALVQYALALVTSEKNIAAVIKQRKLKISPKAFSPVVPPVIVKPETLRRMARLEPRDERYHIANDDLYLVGSAEHSLGSMYLDETLPEDVLPLRYLGFSTAFRREAGSYGKDMKGIIRVHQFDKLEFETFSVAEHGLAEQELLVGLQEKIVAGLGIPYQVVAICTGDMGGPDYRQIDIECWLPGQNKYRETHTSDYMTDYQSRRMGTRVKRASGSSEFVHMNDATAIAIGRMLVAIMENYQNADGTITVPKALVPYMHGVKVIKPS